MPPFCKHIAAVELSDRERLNELYRKLDNSSAIQQRPAGRSTGIGATRTYTQALGSESIAREARRPHTRHGFVLCLPARTPSGRKLPTAPQLGQTTRLQSIRVALGLTLVVALVLVCPRAIAAFLAQRLP